MVIDRILFLHGSNSSLAFPASLFYLRKLIVKDRKVNLAQMIVKHMNATLLSPSAPLPYGHLIDTLRQEAQIPLPEMIWGNLIVSQVMLYPRNLLMDFPSFCWVETSGNTLVPDPNCLVNDLILVKRFNTNYYVPDHSPEFDAGSIAMSVVLTAGLVEQHFKEVKSRLAVIEEKVDRLFTVLIPPPNDI